MTIRMPDEVAAMVRLKALGWGVRSDRLSAMSCGPKMEE
jgi:hypothetical protein